MTPVKPIFLKTYGRRPLKISSWITPGEHKNAFDSSSCESDDGFKPKAKPGKNKRIRQLKETVNKGDEKLSASRPPCRQPMNSRKTAKAKKSTVSSGKSHRNAKKKAMLRLFEDSSDEGNTGIIHSHGRTPIQQHHRIRSAYSDAVVDTKAHKIPLAHKNGDQYSEMSSKKTNKSPPSGGNFVTRGRLVYTRSPVLDSSEEYTYGGRDLKGLKGRLFLKKKQKCTPFSPDFNAEIVGNNMGGIGFLRRPFQELFFNHSGDHNLESCTKKPIFCSTPSANITGKLSHFEPFFMFNQPPNAPSMSQSCIDFHCPLQESLESPPLPQCYSTEENFKQNNLKPHSDQNGNTSANLFSNVGLSVNLTDSESSGNRFVLAVNGLQPVIDDLKERCLTHTCAVQLERIDQFKYLSCLEYLSPGNSPKSQQQLSCYSQPLFNSSISLTADEISNYVKSVVFFETCQRRDSLVESGKINIFPEIKNAQTTVSSSVKQSLLEKKHLEYVCMTATSSVDVDTIALKERIRTKHCRVKLKKLDLSHFKVFWAPLSCTHSHLDTPEQMQETHCLTFAKLGTEDGPEHDGCQENAVVVVQEDSNEAEMETLDNILRMKCITSKAVVRITRVPLSQVEDMLRQRKLTSEVSNMATHVLACGSSPKLGIEVRTEATSSDTANLRKRSLDVPVTEQYGVTKRNRPSKKPNKWNTSADKPGTIRKAGVSGLNLSRWKNKRGSSRTLQKDGAMGLDNSIIDLVSKRHKPALYKLKPAVGFSSPVRASRLNLSPLSCFPSTTQAWSHLKAALSIHRKGKVLLTPRGLRLPNSPDERRLFDVSHDLFTSPFRTPLPKHLSSQLLNNDSLTGEDLSDAQKVFVECNQQRPLHWQDCVLPEQMKKILKIGEGTFGEVFSTINVAGETIALKVIPVEGTGKVNGEDQKTFGEILHEIIISKELSSLKAKQQNQTHGFIGLENLHCVQGCYPPQFLRTWDAFDQARGSENERPDFFGKDQIFIILEYEFGGLDLENSNGKLPSVNTAKSIFHQVTAALAVAEQELHFEHRDLHWGNILVKTTKQKTETYLLDGVAHCVETDGVLVRIIDYSLSRLEVDGLTVSCDISNDEELFSGRGDYQFDIYRLMRQENGNNWSHYNPHTNVLWLHYLCSKLLTMKYRNPRGKAGKQNGAQLICFQKDMLQYNSATEVLKYFN